MYAEATEQKKRHVEEVQSYTENIILQNALLVFKENEFYYRDFGSELGWQMGDIN